MGFAHVAQPSYRAFSFNFGEVFNGASDTLLRTCWGPFGLPQLPGLERSRGTRDPTIVFRGSALLPRVAATGRGPPLVSGRWRILGAALRRASRVTKSRIRQCQRSKLFLFRQETRDILPNHSGGNKRKFGFPGIRWPIKQIPCFITKDELFVLFSCLILPDWTTRPSEQGIAELSYLACIVKQV